MRSSPDGINCGSDCTNTYLYGTSVTLTAIPDNSGSIFAGWSGDCSGTGTCTVSMAAVKNVTATFTGTTNQPTTLVFLGSGDGFALSGSATVFGATGTEKVVLNTGASGVVVDPGIRV